MSMDRALDPNWTRQTIAAGGYVVIIAVLIATTWVALAGISDRRAVVQAAENMLARLEDRLPATAKDGRSTFGAAPAGFPFLQGQTVTVAGAALLERIGGAVNRIHGTVLSSQVELKNADSKDGWINLIVSCDINPASLQPLLYDLESGMPFLFIDQLVVQAPVAGVEQSRMHILLSVSGQWAGGK